MLKQCESVTLTCAPSMPQFAETPLWACEACDDEDVPTSSASERKVSGEDAFNISWWGCFRTQCSDVHAMNGKWRPVRCAHSPRAHTHRQVRSHCPQMCLGCDDREVIMTEEDARVKGLLPKGHKGPLKTIKKVFHAWELTCGRKKGHGKWKGEITRNMIRLYAGAVTKNGDIEEKKSHTKQHLYELLGKPACPPEWKPKSKTVRGTKSTRRA